MGDIHETGPVYPDLAKYRDGSIRRTPRRCKQAFFMYFAPVATHVLVAVAGTLAAHSMQLSNVEVPVNRNFSLARYSRVVSSSNAAPHIKHHDQRRKKPREFAHNQA